MVDKADDKNASWREKYLDALDQQEQQEKQFAAQQELLRRALVRVSVAADGQDDDLDTILGQLRERLRSTQVNDIGNLLTRLDEAALGFEQHRDQNALEVRQSLTETIKPLQNLDVPRAVKKEISQFLAQLPARSKKVRLYPALLTQLAHIQQQALKEIAQPKAGFWQKIVGSKEKVEDASKAQKSSQENTSEHNDNCSEIEKNTTLIEPALITQTTLTVQQPVIVSTQVMPLNSQLSFEFIGKVNEVLLQILKGLEAETPIAKKVQALRALVNTQMTADTLITILEKVRDLVVQAYLSENQAFANYLKNVNQELADIYSAIGGVTETESTRKDASQKMHASVMQEMDSLQKNTETATDLAQLKQQVQLQIGNIRQALDHYQHIEKNQQQLGEQLSLLCVKIKAMEADAAKSQQVLEKHRHKALHDALTGLPNREAYNERCEYEFQRWHRYGRPLTMAVFDIDHFKKINDNYGHQAGDKVLKVIGSSIAKRLREVDFFCRFGGEEFVALMPETALDDAMEVLNKIRNAIANASFNYKEQPLSITLSVGVTQFKQDDDVETAFARADKALYAAKSAGRNCTQAG